jgi:hypothetical protein
VAEQLLASQEGISSMKLVSWDASVLRNHCEVKMSFHSYGRNILTAVEVALQRQTIVEKIIVGKY